MRLHDLRPAEGSRKERIRVGRGIAAGKGKTAGRGTKGQKARAGGSIPAWFEGGQTPLHVRIPKLRGFKNRFRIEFEIVNVGAIAAAAERGAFEVEAADAKPTAKTKGPAQITVNQDILRAVGLVRSLNKPLKILGNGELSTPLFVVADAFTASAREKIEAAGGTVNVLEVPTAPLKALGVDGEERTPAKQSRGAQAATAHEARAREARAETAEAAAAEAAAPKPQKPPKASKADATASTDVEAPAATAETDAPEATTEAVDADPDATPTATSEPLDSAEAPTADDVQASAETPAGESDETTTAKPKRGARAARPAAADTGTEPASAATDEAETTSGDDA